MYLVIFCLSNHHDERIIAHSCLPYLSGIFKLTEHTNNEKSHLYYIDANMYNVHFCNKGHIGGLSSLQKHINKSVIWRNSLPSHHYV